jgi:hypothetical protein
MLSKSLLFLIALALLIFKWLNWKLKNY